MPHLIILSAIFLGGAAALTWELLWFQQANLALGVSAQAAAIVLCSVMLGMTSGSLLSPLVLRSKTLSPFQVYAVLEGLIGVAGLYLGFGFERLENLDTWIFHNFTSMTPAVQAIGIAALVGLPAAIMGATVPVFARIAEVYNLRVSRLYAANVAGASAGILIATFILIPQLGVELTVRATISLNLFVGATLFFMGKVVPQQAGLANEDKLAGSESFSLVQAYLGVFCTGFATFNLEVAWFRSLRAAYQATSESFALVLSAVLVAISLGAIIAPILYLRRRIKLGLVFAIAGLTVFWTTPLVERFDLFAPYTGVYWVFLLKRYALVLLVLGMPMTLIGVGLPWILDQFRQARSVAKLYAMNTLGAVIGSLTAAWVFLPLIGFARTAWLAGIALFLVALFLSPGRRLTILVLGGFGLAVAMATESDVGQLRVQGFNQQKEYRVLASREDPDSTISVVQWPDSTRHLVIDGFYASSDSLGSHYMEWMGRLPMLLHPNPKRALVICFGTGVTASAVRHENPQHLDLVDVSQGVFEMAHLFPANQKILHDQRVRRIVMDGRAWLRRTNAKYEVVTLEPMPPTFAGSNALYSIEFYQLIAKRTTADSVVAQWLPFHIITPEEAASITATFLAVFPSSFLWIDPIDGTGILVGSRAELLTKRISWPGFSRAGFGRTMSDQEIQRTLLYKTDTLRRLAQFGKLITDDNQLLSYGWGRMKWWSLGAAQERNRIHYRILDRLK